MKKAITAIVYQLPPQDGPAGSRSAGFDSPDKKSQPRYFSRFVLRALLKLIIAVFARVFPMFATAAPGRSAQD